MTTKSTLKIILAALLFLGCSRERTPKDFIQMFEDRKRDLNYLIRNVENDSNLNKLFVSAGPDRGLTNIKETYPETYKALKKVGVTDASSHKHVFMKRTSWYYFKTNWSDNYPVYLVHDNLDSIQTRKGFYSKDEVSNETWGLGGNWFLFRLVKEREMKQ